MFRNKCLVLLGDCQKGLGQPEDALDSYLTVVALFDVNPTLTAEARFKSARIFEDLKKLDRARSSYQELLATEYAAEAKQRLAALPAATP